MGICISPFSWLFRPGTRSRKLAQQSVSSMQLSEEEKVVENTFEEIFVTVESGETVLCCEDSVRADQTAPAIASLCQTRPFKSFDVMTMSMDYLNFNGNF